MKFFGESKFAKFANGLVFLLLAVYVLNKVGVLDTSDVAEVRTGYDYEIHKSVLGITTPDELDAALSTWEIDDEGLKSILSKSNITLEQFYESVEINVLKNFSTDMAEFHGLYIEMKSTKYDRDILKPSYDFLVEDFRNHITSQQTGA